MSDLNETQKTSEELIGFASEIVSAYVGSNSVSSEELPELIRTVHMSLASLAHQQEEKVVQKPAVTVRKSIGEDYLICLEDGQKFKSLKRHLRTKYDMTPEEYREKWGLAADYPMVAPGYSKQRSKLAKQMGLGRTGSE